MTWLPLLITGGLLIVPTATSRSRNKPGGRSGSGTDSSTGASIPSNSSGQNNRYIRTSRNCGRCMMER